MFELTDAQSDLLRVCASDDESVAIPAQRGLTKALAEEFYREGNLDGDLVSDIFSASPVGEADSLEYILDLINPGTEREYIAFYLPDTGRVPERIVNMNRVRVPTVTVGNSINCPLKFLRQGRVDILGRMAEAYEGGFVMRDNLDGFTTILRAASVHGAPTTGAAAAGVFDFALTRAMKLAMRRNSRGNSTSVKKNRLTDLYISPEAGEDVRQLVHDKADDFTRKTLADRDDMDGFRFQGVNWHTIDELGESQLFQQVWTALLGNAFTGSAVELVIGLDLGPNGKKNLVKPVKRGKEQFADPALHRRQEFGWYGWQERGYAVLNTKVVRLGQF